MKESVVWHQGVGGFGKPDKMVGHACRFLNEVIELCIAAGASPRRIRDVLEAEITKSQSRRAIGGDPFDIPEEVADCQILLDVFSYYAEVPAEAVSKKMAVNYQREWEVDEEGVLWRPGRMPKEDPDHSKRITLCGSTRFKRAFIEWNVRLTLEGNVVYSVCRHGHADMIVHSPEEKVLLDRVHTAKIDNSDEIFVLDVQGYIGESTRSEIDHAHKTGKKVRLLSEEHPHWTEEECTYVV